MVKEISREAEKTGKVTGVRLPIFDDDGSDPWTTPPSRKRKELTITEPVPKEVEIVLADQLYIEKELIPAQVRTRLCRLAAFQNPEFYKAQAMRMPTFGKPRIIYCSEETSRHVALPRGCLDEAVSLLTELGIESRIRDERCGGQPLALTFTGQLRAEQEVAGKAMRPTIQESLRRRPHSGKTVLAAWLIAQRGVNALVLIHRAQLLQQWVERLSAFLALEKKSIGQLGGGRKKLKGTIDVALIQSLVRKGTVQDCVGNYGHIVIDECHHLPARSFELVTRRSKAKYVTGLSASVTRKDGHHPIIFMQCGPVRFRVNARQQASQRPFTHTVYVRPTNFGAGLTHLPFRPVADARGGTPRRTSARSSPEFMLSLLFQTLAMNRYVTM